jgi:hypothetical protein
MKINAAQGVEQTHHIDFSVVHKGMLAGAEFHNCSPKAVSVYMMDDEKALRHLQTLPVRASFLVQGADLKGGDIFALQMEGNLPYFWTYTRNLEYTSVFMVHENEVDYGFLEDDRFSTVATETGGVKRERVLAYLPTAAAQESTAVGSAKSDL